MLRDLKLRHLPAVLFVSAVLTSPTSLRALQIDYSSTVGGTISFDGAGNFSFGPSSDNFTITDGSAAGLMGEITGTYTIGTITTLGAISSAPVTGTGTFVIHDGASTFAATLQWVDILQIGTAGILNDSGLVDLTGITYNGSNADLLALQAAGSAKNVLSFQFVPSVGLSTLASSADSTSFSGSLTQTVPDGGATLALLGFAVIGLSGLRRKIGN